LSERTIFFITAWSHLVALYITRKGSSIK